MPALQMQFYLTGPEYDRVGFKSWLGRADCREVDNPGEADFVIFTGGSDVNPQYYGERILPCTHYDDKRDQEDIALYRRCLEEGIPMVGVCRGAQFLWVMKGGALVQDVDNHNNGEHLIHNFADKNQYMASSVHHQMVKASGNNGMKLLAVAHESTRRTCPNYEQSGKATDFEIWAWEKDAIICFQGHPEYSGYPNYSKLCLDYIEEYVYETQHTVYTGGRIRVKQENK
jgi:putative glutamine amidotransferase